MKIFRVMVAWWVVSLGCVLNVCAGDIYADLLFEHELERAKGGALDTCVIPLLLAPGSKVSIEMINKGFFDFCSKPFWQIEDADIVEAFLRRVTDVDVKNKAFLSFCYGSISRESGPLVAGAFLRHWVPCDELVKSVLGLAYIIEGSRFFVPVIFLLERYPDVFRSLRRDGFFDSLRSNNQENPFVLRQIDSLLELISD